MSDYRLLLRAKDAYYKGQPIMTDQEYDALEDRLIEQGFEIPIGYDVENKKELPYFMGSLDKVKNIDDNICRYITPKLDGISALWYEGKLYKRTDGVNGIDITCFAKYLNLPKVDYGVRGEIIIPLEYSEYIAQLRNKEFVDLQATVSGIFNSKKYNPIIKCCDFVVYEVYLNLDQREQLKKAKEDGFNVVPCLKKKCNDQNLEKTLQLFRDLCPYRLDGIVLTNKGIHQNVKGNPDYKKAFKRDYPAVEITVRRVEWILQQSGKMQPKVHFDKVRIIDANVVKATAHNAKFIFDNGIGVGSRIMVKRGGDKIPNIKSCLDPQEPDITELKKYNWHWDENGTEIICPDHPDLAKVRTIYFFKNMKVKMFGETTIKNILDQFKIESLEQGVSFIFNHQSFEQYNGIGEKKSSTIIQSLHERYHSLNYIELMVLTPYFHRVGLTKLESIWQVFDLRGYIDYNMLLSVNGIGPKNTQTILEGLPKFRNLLRYLPPREFKWSPYVPCDGPQMVICMTGTRDADVQQICKRRGGLVKSSFTNAVNLVVVKDPNKVSTKLNKARRLGIPIMTVEEFKQEYK